MHAHHVFRSRLFGLMIVFQLVWVNHITDEFNEIYSTVLLTVDAVVLCYLLLSRICHVQERWYQTFSKGIAAFSLVGQFVPGAKVTLANSLPGTYAPCNFHSQELSLPSCRTPQNFCLVSCLDSAEACWTSSTKLLLQHIQIRLTWMRSQQSVDMDYIPECCRHTCVDMP